MGRLSCEGGKIMKILKNGFDQEVWFDDLEMAKSYYAPVEQLQENEFLGDNFENYVKQYNECIQEFDEAKTFEELAIVLNKYTDMFDNGSEWRVVDIKG